MDNPWKEMYQKDRYARDRVIKSVRMVLPFIKDGDTVLDVGCFTQEVKKYLPKDVNYIGIDQEAYHKDNILKDLDKLDDLPPARVVLCLETLEHLKHPCKLLQSLSSVLPSDGYLVVSLPNEATLFHRLRCLLGTVDMECFSSQGKHLHLPSLCQARTLLSQTFEIVDEKYYIAPNACGSQQSWVGKILSVIPDKIHQNLANLCPSLFARGFIFLCNVKENETAT